MNINPYKNGKLLKASPRLSSINTKNNTLYYQENGEYFMNINTDTGNPKTPGIKLLSQSPIFHKLNSNKPKEGGNLNSFLNSKIKTANHTARGTVSIAKISLKIPYFGLRFLKSHQ